ncbi:class I SAM-dependent methyltransferase [Pararhizobium mangrovi]|uniref:Class I SAM-dependent methyltransferase n=1 Tax=Pararhizobium mangrovi TaxID=2590452 RepID=A0A506U7E4_9HYPH|nr:class I SAM-dependent methyltransferase [Pararhizobium mangrovi]TPW29021.1 class I SAM-dependent methyltransferase [Pararhizobium mangrovi]
MLVTLKECEEILRCPRSGDRLVSAERDGLRTEHSESEEDVVYPVVAGTPILIDFSDSVLDRKALLERAGTSALHRPRYGRVAGLIKRLLSPAKKTTRENVEALIRELSSLPGKSRVLVVGGGSIGQGMERLYQDPGLEVVGFDIYGSPNVQFIADAHHIPLASNSFDAVVVQAVLEHVLVPARVVAEIWRVLKPDGIVYAETPFMQQVHEGPYDFSRFTESGHRYLFRNFEVIRSGASGGPGLQFMWAADYLARSLFRSRTAGKLAKLAFFWTQYLDAAIPARYAIDGASGVYFLGRKSQVPFPPAAMASYYQGAQ